MTNTVKQKPVVFLVKRTSLDEKEKPCEGAFKIEKPHTDTRNCDDPKKLLANHGTDGDWYKKGKNHRVENGCIKREIGVDTLWYIELTDLQALTAFVGKYGKCVLDRGKQGFSTLEIYDDYRE